MSSSRTSCTECSRMRQDAMKLRMDISSLQASNRALIDKQKQIEQEIKQQKLQLRQQQLNVTTPGISEAACADELDRVKSEYFNLRQELEGMRENLRSNDHHRAEAERRAVDAENWIQIKDSIIEKQRNLLKEMEANKAELQTELTSSKTSFEEAQQELTRRIDELAIARLEALRLEEELSRRDEEIERFTGGKKSGASGDKEDKEEVEEQGNSGNETDHILREQLEKVRADLAKSETSRRASVNDLAVTRRRVALKEASLKSLQAALEAEKLTASQKENAHLLLNSENAYLRSENSSLKEEAERSTATLSGLETRVSELEVELNHKTESAAELTTEIEALKEALKEAQERLSDYDKRVRCSSQGETGSLDNGTAALGTSIDPASVAGDECNTGPPQPGEEACLAAVQEKITRQETQIADLNALLSYRESCILKMHDEMEKLRSAIDVANTEKDTLNASITILKKELAQAREEARGKREAVAEVENKIEEIRLKRSREYDRRKRAEEEADELYRENEELRHRVAKLEANVKQTGESSQKSRDPMVSELQSVVKELRTDNEAKRSELFDTRSKLEEKLSVIEELQTKLKAKERSVTEMRNQVYSMRTSADSHQDELNQLRGELTRVNEEYKRAKQDLASILASNRYLSESCNEMRAKLKEKERQISELSEKNQSLIRAHEAPCGDEATSSSNVSLPGSVPGCEQQLDSISARPDSSEKLHRLQHSLEAMESKLRELSEDKHRLAQECEEARSRTLDLELNYADARSELAKASAEAESSLTEMRRLQGELKQEKTDSEKQISDLRYQLSGKDIHLTRKRRREGELIGQTDKEKQRRLENGPETKKANACSKFPHIERDISDVQSYVNQKDEEFAHLTKQLLETQEQEQVVRNDLSRSKSELQESQLRVRKLEAELTEARTKCRSLQNYQEHADELMRALRQANSGFEERLNRMQKELALSGSAAKKALQA